MNSKNSTSRKKVNKIIKILIDILMYADFIFLMSHATFQNLLAHAVMGIALFVLFIVHHILNFWFYKTIKNGKYNAQRILLSATDWILLILIILMAISSILVSGIVFDFSPFVFSESAKTFHKMSTCWGFIVMCFHLGLHTDLLFIRLENKICNNKKSLKLILNLVYLIIFFAGIFALYKAQLHFYLFNLSGWKLAAPNMFISVLEYLGITFSFIILAHWIKKILKF